jgi:predicted nucleic acid-binding protein
MDKSVMEEARDIFVDLKKSGNMIGENDILIAAYCKANDCVLVTNNIGHFAKIKDLKMENWAEGITPTRKLKATQRQGPHR